MLNDIIQKRLNTYTVKTIEDEQDALKEILQEIILYALSTTDFFEYARFHGGTSLRILHNLPRFSEDLDFVLQKPNSDFAWQPYYKEVLRACELFGIELEVHDKRKLDQSVQKIFLKDNSIGKMLNLQFHHHPGIKFKIKLEIDVNPPVGANHEIKFLNFPLDCAITCHDLKSNFTGKLHAMLCRPYVKGRDWFDYTWYIRQNVSPNYSLLSNALNQAGPWRSKDIEVNKQWLIDSLNEKVMTIDWNKARQDVLSFLRSPEREAVSLWGEAFFLDQSKKLSAILNQQDSLC